MDIKQGNNFNNIQPNDQLPLKRVSIEPGEEMKKLERNEIGIKSDLKGTEIKKYVDRAINKLIYANYKVVTLKAIGNACSKVLSIADILRRKIKNLTEIHKNYSRKYIAKYESDDGKIHREKEFRLPCLDIDLVLDNVDPSTLGYMPPLSEEELDKNFIDPLNPPFRPSYSRGGYRGRGNGGFRGNRGSRGGRGNNFRGRGANFRGRGQFRSNYRDQYADDYNDNSYYNNYSNNDNNYNDEYVPRRNPMGGRGGYNQRYQSNQFRGRYRGRGMMYNQRYGENDNYYPNTNYQYRNRY